MKPIPQNANGVRPVEVPMIAGQTYRVATALASVLFIVSGLVLAWLYWQVGRSLVYPLLILGFGAFTTGLLGFWRYEVQSSRIRTRYGLFPGRSSKLADIVAVVPARGRHPATWWPVSGLLLHKRYGAHFLAIGESDAEIALQAIHALRPDLYRYGRELRPGIASVEGSGQVTASGTPQVPSE